MTRSGMAKHLQTCPQRRAAQATVNQAKGRDQPLYHLQVQDAWYGEYWLQLEMRGDASLEDLDTYLRAIWLECCGHLSAFTVGPYHYTQIIADSWMSEDEKSMDVPAHQLFAPGMSIPYVYDFGTTSRLVINVIAQRVGKPTSAHPIVLMARNQTPVSICAQCDQPATYLCLQCLNEGENSDCEFCDEHIAAHECEDYGLPIAIVNSPRMGMCGYAGPAQAPY